jgi:hypothetical protein
LNLSADLLEISLRRQPHSGRLSNPAAFRGLRVGDRPARRDEFSSNRHPALAGLFQKLDLVFVEQRLDLGEIVIVQSIDLDEIVGEPSGDYRE